MNRKVYISGMHSGQNPCAGGGIARCLRRAFPEITLVGVDHWQGSSGLHDGVVDDIMLLPQWKQVDNARHSAGVRRLLDDGNLWISGLDIEVHWFADNFGRHDHLLAPTKAALELTAKPAVKAFEALGFRVPDFIPVSLPDSEIHAFLRRNAWQCWLKGPYHDAKRISSWGSFERARDAMASQWRTARLFVQRNAIGMEESLTFSAYKGELLAAVTLEKRQITPEGKTWAGRVTPVDGKLFNELAEVIRLLEWSGGGEVEYVRDPDGNRWIIECNPRFPAWIYGGALAGSNLPARLVSRIWDLPFVESVAKYPLFTRVVQEIPAKEAVGLPLRSDPTLMEWAVDGKKGKGGIPTASAIPSLKQDSDDEDGEEAPRLRQDPEKLPAIFAEEIESLARTFEGETPARITLEKWTASRFETVGRAVMAAARRKPEVRIGYSVKTSPTDAHLRKAKALGFHAECISQLEVKRALSMGWPASSVILNGPGKFWPLTSAPVTGLHMLFCDSVDEFERVIAMPGVASVLGFRMRLPKLPSRFGNSVEDFADFERIVSCVRRIKGVAELGFHFHMPSWAIGVQRWNDALQSLFIWCQTMERLSGVPVRHLDMGGGFFPADLERLDFAAIQRSVQDALPGVRAIYFEPGRSLTQDSEALVSRVLDVRKTHDGRLAEVVVDACIAEMPLIGAFSHRLFFRAQGSDICMLLGKGTARVLGRICMEDDVLSGGAALPEDIKIGDYLIFGDAGGYERSMSYEFGRG